MRVPAGRLPGQPAPGQPAWQEDLLLLQQYVLQHSNRLHKPVQGNLGMLHRHLCARETGAVLAVLSARLHLWRHLIAHRTLDAPEEKPGEGVI
jgi:hypothetical protein